MKKRIIIPGLFLVVLLGVATGCEATMETDARELATLQMQKSEKIRSLLACTDSIRKVKLLEQIRSLEIRFDLHLKTCQKKYSTPAEWADFEQSYDNHLTKVKMAR
ncbi:MAG: hypothetical protein EOM83_15170 [Clostridia bacterium]|nr:hypothetical protein [Clostridia bacterium]